MNNIKKDEELFGLIGPDLPDTRDVLLESVVPLKVDYPPVIDFDKHTIISHQHYGTCTSHSGSGSDENQEGKEYQKKTNLASKFNYIKIKVISGRWDKQGDYLRNSLKALEKFGIPFEEDFPDERMANWNEYVHTPIPKEVEEKALTHKIKGYARIGKKLEDFMSGMWTSQFPVPTGMMWYESYKVGKDGYLPPADGKERGGHAVRVPIIDQQQEKVWFANSWSTNWGKDGYFYIPFSEWNKHNIWDCWVIYPLNNSEIKSMYKLIKLQNTTDIYAVKNNKKHLIINRYCFEAGMADNQWGNWESVDPVDQKEFDSYKLGDVFIRVSNE